MLLAHRLRLGSCEDHKQLSLLLGEVLTLSIIVSPNQYSFVVLVCLYDGRRFNGLVEIQILLEPLKKADEMNHFMCTTCFSGSLDQDLACRFVLS